MRVPPGEGCSSTFMAGRWSCSQAASSHVKSASGGEVGGVGAGADCEAAALSCRRRRKLARAIPTRNATGYAAVENTISSRQCIHAVSIPFTVISATAWSVLTSHVAGAQHPSKMLRSHVPLSHAHADVLHDV
eukprot:6213821-Pleurochrysis_carterae.AAC.1